MSDDNLERRILGEIKEPLPQKAAFVDIKNAVFDEMVNSGFSRDDALKVIAFMLISKQ